MSDVELVISNNGEPPLLLARAPGQVADQGIGSGAVVLRGARSGNPNFDPLTGKFSGTKSKALQVVAQTVQQGALPMRTGVPQGVNPVVWEKRMDQVRAAARELDMMDEKGAIAFLTGKVTDINQVDINAFLADVKIQRMADLVDVLDARVRAGIKKVPVRLVAPQAWTVRAFGGLTAPEAGHLVQRLQGKGWDPSDISTHIIAKMKNKEIKGYLEQLYGEAPKKEGKKLPPPVGTKKV
jgi:hypothetical protein